MIVISHNALGMARLGCRARNTNIGNNQQKSVLKRSTTLKSLMSTLMTATRTSLIKRDPVLPPVTPLKIQHKRSRVDSDP